jgi:hypothetical protein
MRNWGKERETSNQSKLPNYQQSRRDVPSNLDAENGVACDSAEEQ